MKNYIIVTAIASILLVPALFADTTGTGTTTSTGTTSTGTTGTGTTGTGTTGTGTTGTGTTGTGTTGTGTTGTGTSGTGTTGTGTTGTGTTGTGTTGTGTTGTGTTGTGVNCNTGSTVQANQAALLAAQQIFSTEIARLVAQKQTAYSGAQTLTGTARVTALQSANVAFRTGFMTAIKKLNAVKQSNRAHHSDIRECKKEVKKIEKNEKKEHKEEIKSQVKSLKDRIKELQQSRKNGNSHR